MQSRNHNIKPGSGKSSPEKRWGRGWKKRHKRSQKSPVPVLSREQPASRPWPSSLTSLPCHAKLMQSCPTLCNPRNCSPPGSSVHGILQARILEWVPFPPPRDLPDPGVEPRSPTLQADSVSSEPPGQVLEPTSLWHLLHWQAGS